MPVISLLITYLCLLVAAAYGWVSNIITLFAMDGFSGEMALRVIGIPIAIVGAVAGYF